MVRHASEKTTGIHDPSLQRRSLQLGIGSACGQQYGSLASFRMWYAGTPTVSTLPPVDGETDIGQLDCDFGNDRRCLDLPPTDRVDSEVRSNPTDRRVEIVWIENRLRKRGM